MQLKMYLIIHLPIELRTTATAETRAQEMILYSNKQRKFIDIELLKQ